MAQGPLHGVRVLAVEQYGAGPYGSMLLAELGAEVIKIENLPAGGDVSRGTGPFMLGPGDSQFYQTFNKSKRSIALDLKTEAGQTIARKLAATAQIVCNNLRGDQPAKLGLDYVSLRDVNPAIVCAHLSAYGRDNERASWPGYDYLMQAETGFMALTGEPGTAPARFGLSVVDFMTGMMMALTAVSALHSAQQTGQGMDMDVSLFDVALHQLTYPATWYLNEGHVTARVPRSGHPTIVPSESFPTADGALFVMCQLPKFWERFAVGIGRADLKDDPRFKDAGSRLNNREALAAEISAATRTQTTAHWLSIFRGQVPVAPINALPEALDNPFVAALGMIQELDHPAMAGLRLLAAPFKVDGQRPQGGVAAPLGGDTAAILHELGYDEVAIKALGAAGIVKT